MQYWKEEGLERVVLARETSAEEIREMKEKVDIEIEALFMVPCVLPIQVAVCLAII